MDQPPIIALHGLRPTSYPKYPITKCLSCYVNEPRPFLKLFRSQVIQTFVANGFVPFVEADVDKPVTLAIMETSHRLRTDIYIQKSSHSRGGFYLAPDFDASDLHPKYENFPWTGDFPLDKLCISELGPKDIWRDGKIVRTGYRDIACVPLPGVAAVENETSERSDEKYSPAVYMLLENRPVTPSLIRSTPPARAP